MASWSTIVGVILILLGLLWLLSTVPTKYLSDLPAQFVAISPDVMIGYPVAKTVQNKRIIAIMAIMIGLAMVEYEYNFTGIIKFLCK